MRNAERGMRNGAWLSLVSSISGFRVRHSKGFTLLEVMISVAILSLVIVSLIGLKNQSVRDVQLAERMTTATLLAKRIMTATLVAKDLPTAESDGVFEEEEYKDFVWKKAVIETPLANIKEVRVAVLWKDGERQEMVELVSYE